jgi:hypothetical protein
MVISGMPDGRVGGWPRESDREVLLKAITFGVAGLLPVIRLIGKAICFGSSARLCFSLSKAV